VSKKRLMVVEAHSDDSAISASGFLDRHRDQYDYHFLVTTISDIQMRHQGLVYRDQRIAEYQNYVKYFNGVWHRTDGLPFDTDARLDTKPKCEIVAAFENVLAAVQPHALICQGPSFHHDHTIVYEALIAATRPTALFCPEEMYIMENPTYVHSIGPATDFKPNMYCRLTEDQIQMKSQCFQEIFPSQVRRGNNYLSVEGLTAWARYRGIECRSTYAEAFQTYIRVV